MTEEVDIVDLIIDFESGTMLEDDIPPFFQRLINSGMAWNLQGSYGRMAQHLIDVGLCTHRKEVAV